MNSLAACMYQGNKKAEKLNNAFHTDVHITQKITHSASNNEYSHRPLTGSIPQEMNTSITNNTDSISTHGDYIYTYTL